MSNKTIQSDDKPIANIAIYRLDIYRLLSLLWADKKITSNNILQPLSNDYCESEANRLLILTAVVTRQILDRNKSKYKAIRIKKCGEFWHNHPVENSMGLELGKACNMIIHATDIVIKTGKYFYSEKEGTYSHKGEDAFKKQDKMYFQDTINITGQGKHYAELNLEEFTQHCIELSDRMTKGE